MAKRKNYKRDDNYRDNSSSRSSDRAKSNLGNVAMFARSTQSLIDSASLAFSDVLGEPINLSQLNYFKSGTTVTIPSVVQGIGATRVPGICALHWTPVVGSSLDNNSPVNVAALNVYSYVRHANSGSANYDHTDLMMYIIAVGGYFAFLSSLTRLYGVLNYYNQKNRYLPATIVTAMGYNYADLVNHINDLRAYLNHKISEAGVLWIPNTMPFAQRWFNMSSMIYKDGDSDKSQIYLYAMDGKPIFQPKTSTSGSAVSYVNRWGMGFSDIVDLCEQMSVPLISDEDVGIMAGDILKAYGADKIYGINQVPEDYLVLPVYDEDALMEMHNATIFQNFTVSRIEQNLTSDPGYLIQTIDRYMDSNDPRAIFGYCLPKVLDILHDDVSPAKVMLATRLMAYCKLDAGGTSANPSYHITVTACGTEVITESRVYYAPGTGYFTVYQYVQEMDESDMLAAFSLCQFHYSPLIYRFKDRTADWSTQLSGVMGELENYTIVDEYPLVKMHRTAVYSEFGVPSI